MRMRMRVLAWGVLAGGLVVSGYAQGPAGAQAPRTDVALDVLSDKGTADLNPYFERLVGALQKRWQPLVMAAEPNAPAQPQETVIGITILPDGKLGAMRLNTSTHDAALNKAAWAATQENDYGPPPARMRDKALKLRLHFTVK